MNNSELVSSERDFSTQVPYTLYALSGYKAACKLRISSVRRLYTGRPSTSASFSRGQKRVVIATDIYTFVTLPQAVT